MDLRVAPASRATNSLLLLPPFPPDAERWALTCVESIICVSATARCRRVPGTIFPDAAPRPANKAVIDRGRRAVSFRAVTPAAAALEHMNDAADNAPVVKSHPTPTPSVACKNDPSDGAETGGAEPQIAEQSRSWRAANGEREVMRGS